MQTTISEDEFLNLYNSLPAHLQQEVSDYIEFLLIKYKSENGEMITETPKEEQ